jgi:hypothetical protein
MNINFMNSDFTVSAVHQTVKHFSVSDRYNFVSTQQVVEHFERLGWGVSRYSQSRVRHANKEGFQYHRVEMRPIGRTLNVGDSELRLIISNAHCGTHAVRVFFGLYRKVCSNGLIIADSTFEGLRLRHTAKNIDEQLQQMIDKITIAAERLNEIVLTMSGKTLTEEQADSLAKKMLAERFTEEQISACPRMIRDVQAIRRIEDAGMDLWSVYNRIQENLTKGFMSSDWADGKGRKLRAVTSALKDTNMNVGLWEAAMTQLAA